MIYFNINNSGMQLQILSLVFMNNSDLLDPEYPLILTPAKPYSTERNTFHHACWNINYYWQVLGTRRLMHISHEEFEKVMAACFEVFGTWDDEYEKLQGLLRDIVKKKREESLKMVWRVNPAHKKLQNRLEQMRK